MVAPKEACLEIDSWLVALKAACADVAAMETHSSSFDQVLHGELAESLKTLEHNLSQAHQR